MEPSPLVSVVIPAYNRADTIGAALDGALAQTVTDLEVIVVDDASADATVQVVQAYADPRVRLVRHETNQGGNAARRTGIAAGIGRYIGFLDSDDCWESTKLERQLRRLEEAGEAYGLCYCWFDVVLDDGTLLPALRGTSEGIAVPELLTSNIIGTYSVALVRRSALEAVGGPDPALPSCQDWDLYLRMNERTGICVVPEVLVRYRLAHSDPHRISSRGANVAAGHRQLYRRIRTAYPTMPRGAVLESQRTFLDAFAEAGAPRDALRVIRDVPAAAWPTRSGTRIGRQVARAVRNRARRA